MLAFDAAGVVPAFLLVVVPLLEASFPAQPASDVAVRTAVMASAITFFVILIVNPPHYLITSIPSRRRAWSLLPDISGQMDRYIRSALWKGQYIHSESSAWTVPPLPPP